MNDEINNFAQALKDITPIQRVRDLHAQLQGNVAEVEQIMENIAQNKDNMEVDQLESLYANEFMLLMDNVGLYDDLKLNLDRVEKTPETEFELARIRRDASKMVLVKIVEL